MGIKFFRALILFAIGISISACTKGRDTTDSVKVKLDAAGFNQVERGLYSCSPARCGSEVMIYYSVHSVDSRHQGLTAEQSIRQGLWTREELKAREKSAMAASPNARVKSSSVNRQSSIVNIAGYLTIQQGEYIFRVQGKVRENELSAFSVASKDSKILEKYFNPRFMD